MNHRVVRGLAFFAVLTGSGLLPGQDEAAAPECPIAVLGSSVAAGWVTSYEAKHDLQNGYAARLGRLLETRGIDLVNISIPGNSTGDVLGRMDADLEPISPEIVLIGLSLGNEQLVDDRDRAVETYLRNLPQIIERLGEAGRIPVVGLCYPHDSFDAGDYAALKRVNLAIEGWDVATINFLGALDDGAGRFVKGYTFDEGHPDNHGHEEMFLAIVPSLFESLLDGVPAPTRSDEAGGIKVAGAGKSPLVYVPDDVMHSFSLGFSILTKGHGNVAAVHAETGLLLASIDAEGHLIVNSGQGGVVKGEADLTDGGWHDVLLSHRYLQGKLLVFVDGKLIGGLDARLEPRQFVLGGSGEEGDSPREARYGDLLVYRAALNDDEARALKGGALPTGSLEVYAPLHGETPGLGAAVENRAQSSSVVRFKPATLEQELAILADKIEAARVLRENEFVVEETPVIELPADLLARYAGKYEISPGDQIEITREKNRLLLVDGDNRIELFAESQTKFYIRTAGDMTVSFEKDEEGDVTRLVLNAGGQQIPAVKVE